MRKTTQLASHHANAPPLGNLGVVLKGVALGTGPEEDDHPRVALHRSLHQNIVFSYEISFLLSPVLTSCIKHGICTP